MPQKYASSTSSPIYISEVIRSSSFRVTNISSSPKSDYPIPVPYFRIRSSKNSAIFYSKLIMEPIRWRGAKYSKSEPQLNGLEGGFEPDLNGYLTSTIVSAPPVGVEFESNCSRTTVNQAKILFQSYEVPPPNPTTSIKIDLQNILIGFGGSRSSPKGGGGGRGRVRVELLAHHRK